MAATDLSPQLGRGDRACLRWTAWTFAGLSAVVLVSTVGAAATWWHVAGREGVAGGQRLLPTLVLLALGTVASVAFYGLSCLCRVVGRMCADPVPSARPRAASNKPAFSPRFGPENRGSVGGSRSGAGARARQA